MILNNQFRMHDGLDYSPSYLGGRDRRLQFEASLGKKKLAGMVVHGCNPSKSGKRGREIKVQGWNGEKHEILSKK
jgi:hypothetical protein